MSAMQPTTLDPTFAQLLAHLHRTADDLSAYGYYWQLSTKTSTWWRGKCPSAPSDSVNVYYGVHPCTENRGSGGRSTVETIAAINCLFADFDNKHFDDDKAAALAHIHQIEPPPSAIIDSGGGYHCYWLLTTPWQLDTEAERKRAKALQARWVAYVGSDGGAKDLARVLRVPGTLNHKYNPPRPVNFVYANLDTVYVLMALADLANQLPLEAAVVPTPSTPLDDAERRRNYAAKALADELARVATANNGTRNSTLNAAAFSLGQLVAAGVLEVAAIGAALLSAATAAGLPQREAEQTIASGLKAGQRSPRTLPSFEQSPQVAPSVPQGAAPRSSAPSVVPLTRSEAILKALHGLGYTFRLNLCADQVEVNGQPIDDVLEAQIRTQMRDRDIRPLSAVEDAYITEAARNAYHPIKDYLNSLQWDGGDHIAAFAAKLRGDDPPVVYADGRQQPLLSVYLRRWLIGAVAKVLKRAQNGMLVLARPQGIGKSALAAWLCSGLPAYFIAAPINVSDKDSDVRLMSRFIWEVSELDATTRRADVSALKAFISKDTVTVRKSYGRNDTVKPALASLIGTVNRGAGFLADETGNRRFMVASVQAIDWSYIQIDVNQLWAQAVALYQQGEAWRLLPEEARQQAEQNKAYEVESLLDDWIMQHFNLNSGDQALMTAAQIVDHLHSKEIRLTGNARTDAMELARVLTRLGLQRGDGRARRSYKGIAPRYVYAGSGSNGSNDYGDNLGDNLPDEVVTKSAASESLGDNRDNRDNLNSIEVNSDANTYAALQAKSVLRDRSQRVVTLSPRHQDAQKMVTTSDERLTPGVVTPTLADLGSAQRRTARDQLYDDGKAEHVRIFIASRQWGKARSEIGKMRSAARKKALEAELIAAEQASRPLGQG
jgi:hypothetical protein